MKAYFSLTSWRGSSPGGGKRREGGGGGVSVRGRGGVEAKGTRAFARPRGWEGRWRGDAGVGAGGRASRARPAGASQIGREWKWKGTNGPPVTGCARVGGGGGSGGGAHRGRHPVGRNVEGTRATGGPARSSLDPRARRPPPREESVTSRRPLPRSVGHRDGILVDAVFAPPEGRVFRGGSTIARRAGTAPRPHVRRIPLRGEPVGARRRARAVLGRSRGEPRRVLRAAHPRVPLVGRPPPDLRRARRRGRRDVVGPHPRRPRRRPHQLHGARQDPGRPEPRRAPRGLPRRASPLRHIVTTNRRGCPPMTHINPSAPRLTRVHPVPVPVPSSRRTPTVAPPRRTSPISPRAATNTTGLTSSSATVARSSSRTSATAEQPPKPRRRRCRPERRPRRRRARGGVRAE